MMKKTALKRVEEWIVPIGRGMKMVYRRHHGKHPSRLLRQLLRNTLRLAGAGTLAALFPQFVFAAPPVNTLPTGGQVAGGQVVIGAPQTTASGGARMDITQSSQQGIINWQTFSVGANAQVNFNQPNSSAVTLNRVAAGSPSEIFGQITATGQIFLVNPSGILVGQGAQVNVGSFAASTLNITDADFLSRNFNFTGGNSGGKITNQGTITVANGGYVALLAPEVSNQGVIVARLGTVGIAAGDQVSLQFQGDRLINLVVSAASINTLIENKQAIYAPGGQIIIAARSAGALAASVVNNSGIIEAASAADLNGTQRAGSVTVDAGNGTLTNTGTISANGVAAGQQGGAVNLSGGFVSLGGTVSADGYNLGGTVTVAAQSTLSLAQNVSARGTAGGGGSITYSSGGSTVETSTSVNDVSGQTDGGNVSVSAAGGLLSSGTYKADGADGNGGRVDLSGGTVRLLSTQISATGALQGGLVRIGGAFQGGAAQAPTDPLPAPDPQSPNPLSAALPVNAFVSRWGRTSSISNADQTFVNDTTTVDVSAKGAQGVGGTAVVWSNSQTTMLGTVTATGAQSGGAVEVSSAQTLNYVSLDNIRPGAGGQLLLDPQNLIVGNAVQIQAWTLAAVVGQGYGAAGASTAGSVGGSNTLFGSSVALNSVGDQMAVGAPNDAGSSGGSSLYGAVRLYSFTTNSTNFSGAALNGVIGKGYTGGNNLNVSIAAGDLFGQSVALNRAGTATNLAVGAPGTNGSAGAVYLFNFSGANFTSPTLTATIANGATGGKNINASNFKSGFGLSSGDQFGYSVALNGDGSNLVVGANQDGGPGSGATGSGAAYLIKFSDTSFSSGTVKGIIGYGYTGGSNYDLSGVSNGGANIGQSVALNAAGDVLAVGAPFEGNNFAGQTYLFKFSDTSFGSAPVLKNTIGDGTVATLTTSSAPQFGSGVALSGDGSILAVGANGYSPGGGSPYGATYLFTLDSNLAAMQKALVTATRAQTGENFGWSVALNNPGTNMVIGAPSDGGSSRSSAGNGVGAVYLYSVDPTFSGAPSLLGVMGQGTAGVGSADVDVTALGTGGGGGGGGNNLSVSFNSSGTLFGSSVALNTAGTRMAVGDPGDNGATGGGTASGAVRIIDFTAGSFTGASLTSVIGLGYTGGHNIDMSAVAKPLVANDKFGASVSLNGSGNMLAVGATGDTNGAGATGSVRIFDVSGYTLTSTIGYGYSGGSNINLSGTGNGKALAAGDAFGASVSLNTAGTLLAVGATGDTNGGGTATGSVRIFDLNSHTRAATIGYGYSGTNDVNLSATSGYAAGGGFGASVAFNGAGDRLAVGSPNDNSNIGAVRLFTFSNTSAAGGQLVGSIGSGAAYNPGSGTSAQSVNISLPAGGKFGSSVALDNAADRLAVGSPLDNGGSSISASGAVRVIGFTDGNFSGGNLQNRIGAGYTTNVSGQRDVDLSVPTPTGSPVANFTTLHASDNFGSAVAFNGAGTTLAVGASGDDGNPANAGTNRGAVYLFTSTALPGGLDPATQTFASGSGTTATVNASSLNTLLSGGTSVILQASNDLTVSNAINSTSATANLELDAGRSVLINANITTSGGGLKIVANDIASAGVVNADRSAGNAVITMANGVSINTGSGTTDLRLLKGNGNTNTASGNISLGSITAKSIYVFNNGPTAGSGVVLNSGASLTATGNTAVTGDPTSNATIELVGQTFANNSGSATPLNAGTGNRWLVWSGDPSADTRGGMAYDFKQYNAPFATSTPAQSTGNGFLYSLAPSVTPTLTGSVSKTYDGGTTASLAAGNYSVTGAVDGDTVTLNNPASGTYGSKNAGSTINVSATGISIAGVTNGSATVYGYQLASSSANANIGSISAKAVTLTAPSVTKTYDGGLTYTASAGDLTSLSGGLVGGDTVTAATIAYTDKNAGTGNKTVNFNAVTISDGNGGSNYTVTRAGNSTSTINPLAVTLTAPSVTKTYDGGLTYTPTAGDLTSLSGSLVGGDTVTAATIAYTDKNAGTGNKTVNFNAVTISDGNGGGNYTVTRAGNSTSTINPLAVTLTGSRTYDGTNAISGNILTASNLVGGDSLTISGSGTLASKNAGSESINSFGTMALSNNNYTLTGASGSVSIGALAVTLTAPSVTKTYDGGLTYTTTAGDLTSLSGSLVGGDTVTAATIAYTDKNAGTGNKTVNFNAVTISDGNGGNNYTVTRAGNSTSTINPLAVTLTGTRTYDGTNAVNGGILTASNLVGGDSLTFSGSGTLASKNVGSEAINSLGTLAVSNNNYTLTGATGSVSISAKAVTLTAPSVTKTYDGGLTYTASTGDLTSLSGSLVGGDTVTAATIAYTDKNAGTGNKTVNFNAVTISDGNGGSNYTVTRAGNSTSTINPLAVTLTAPSVTKTYDGGLTYTTTAGDLTSLSGSLVGGDTVTAATIAYTDKNAGTGNKTVNLNSVTILDGNGGGNYTVTRAGNSTSTINPKAVTLTAPSETKTYDGGLTYTTTAGDLTSLSGSLVGGDTVTAATIAYTDKNAGTGNKTVNLNSVTILDGNGGGNYTVTRAGNSTSTINPLAVTLTAPSVTKTYDGGLTYTTTAGDLTSLSGSLVGGDTVTAATIAYTDKNAGTGNKTVNFNAVTISDGNGGNNYTVTRAGNSTSTINPLAVTLTAPSVTKTYDGGLTYSTTAGDLTSLSGSLVGGDTVTAATIAYTDKNAGTSNKTVNLNAVTILDGNGGGNYTVTRAGNSTSTINPLAVTLTAPSVTKTYDGGLTYTTTAGDLTSLSGSLVGGDTVTAATIAYTDKNVGTANKTINLNAVTISDGNGGGNYTVTRAGNSTSTINPLAVTLTAPSVTKTYDGGLTYTTTAGDLTSLSGSLVGGDTVTAATIAYTDKNAGTGNKTVNFNAVTISDGNGGGNYTVTRAGNSTSTINPLAVTLTAPSVTKTYDGGLTYTTTAGDLTSLSGSLVGGDTVTAATIAYTNKNAGTGNKAVNLNAVTISDGNGGGNYTVTRAGNSTSTINPLAVTLTSPSVTKTYDGGLTYTTTAGDLTSLSGSLVGGDTVTAATIAYTDKNAGTGKTVNLNAVTISDGNGGGNYTVTRAGNSTSVINKAVLTVTADDASKIQGQPNPALTGTIKGLVTGDTPAVVTGLNFSTDAVTVSPAGLYSIIPAGGVATNYSFVYKNGTLTIVEGRPRGPFGSSAFGFTPDSGSAYQFLLEWFGPFSYYDTANLTWHIDLGGGNRPFWMDPQFVLIRGLGVNTGP